MAKTLKIREDINTDSDMKNILAKFGAVKQHVGNVTEDAFDIKVVNTQPVDFNQPVVETPPVNINQLEKRMPFVPNELREVESRAVDNNLSDVNILPVVNDHTDVFNQPVDFRHLVDIKPLEVITPPGGNGKNASAFEVNVELSLPGVNILPSVEKPPEEKFHHLADGAKTTSSNFTSTSNTALDLTEDDLFAQCGSVTNYGYYCLLRRKIIENDGIIRINAFCKHYGCDKKALLAVIKRLEDKELFYTISSGQEGRRLILCGGKNPTGEINTPGGENRSSSYNNINNKLLLHAEENTTGGDFPTWKEKPYHLPSWERALQKSNAETLFYMSKVTKTNCSLFSMQLLTFYKRLSSEKGQAHTIALFLGLLPKAKDNINSYIITAHANGAEPTPEEIKRAENLLSFIDNIDKFPEEKVLKEKIVEAALASDTKQLLFFTKQQEDMMVLQKIFGTPIEQLKEERDKFLLSFLDCNL
jgi:hypothetical protein